MSRLFRNAIVLLLSLSAWAAAAKDEGTDQLASELCEGMLGFSLTEAPPEFQFDVSKALGARGFLGSYPEPTSDNRHRAASQGVIYWGHSFAVKSNIMAAVNHDAKFKGLNKIMYLISPIDVSDLTDDTDPAVIRERFQRIFETADLIYFDEVNGQQSARRISREIARKVLHPQTIEYFTKDDRGPRFAQGGWVFPQMRGVLTYQNVFESGSSTIKALLKDARRLEAQGYRFDFNRDPVAALEKARDQMRIEKDEEGRLVVQTDNSRYHSPEDFGGTLDSIKKGRAVTVEVRDPQGRFLAGILGERAGNIFHFDTIFYDFTTRDGSRVLTAGELAQVTDLKEVRSQIDLAKMAVLAALLRLHDHGINVSDAGMVSKFTASLKGVYISGEEFSRHVADLAGRPAIDVDLSTPFSFQGR